MLPAHHPASDAVKEAVTVAKEAAALPNPEELRKSGLIDKLKTVITSVAEACGKVAGTLKNVEGSIDVVKRLVGYYNNVAPIFGLPPIPFPP
jgi:hypothetical protein